MTRILIIEDEPSFVEALEFLLSKEGFTVEVASTLISSALKAKIREEAQELNLIKKTSKLPL